MNDIRFAISQLFKEPRFTAVAVIALALGIGANPLVALRETNFMSA
jgi:hypothetical protein